MKQVLQHLSSGQSEVFDVPAPVLRAGHILVRTTSSVISPGTERMLRDFGRASLVGKALQQRERVKDVIAKARTDGLITTIEAVRAKLDQPIPLGYCNVGRVVAVGADVTGFQIGNRVVSNGPHAEIVRVPVNLAACIPDAVSDDRAGFAVLSAIALQGIRLLAPTLGECVAVIGLGLIGLMAVQLLRAQGVRVLGIDLDMARCALARQFGAETVCLGDGEDALARAADFSRGRGVDGVLICASAKSNAPIEQAAQMARQRGRIILVGVVGLDIPRDPFYRKELTFQVSCSYGPGRYDPIYEERGVDYPVGYVRWTAQRNFEAVLDMMAAGSLDVDPFISCRFPIDKAAEAYSRLDEGGSILGIMLDYPQDEHEAFVPATVAIPCRAAPRNGGVRIGVIGAGNYASRQLIPAMQKAGAKLQAINASGGPALAHVGRKFGFERISTDTEALIGAADIDLVVIATRHDSHANLVARAFAAGKAVFVEKPLALTEDELTDVIAAHECAAQPFLMVGFNRRFSPYIVQLRRAMQATKVPAAIIITVNAGAIPADHWTQDRAIGGGRIIGEGCHFIDLARHLAGATITSIHATSIGRTAADKNPEDKALITLNFANGTVASIQYLANGHKSFPKERIEVFCGENIWRIDNFRRFESFGAARVRGSGPAGQNKGQEEMADAVMVTLREGGASPIPFGELVEVANHTIIADRLLRGG